MDFNRIHDHLLVVMAEDIKTGFDFAAGGKRKLIDATNFTV
jgi:hypothetical protein